MYILSLSLCHLHLLHKILLVFYLPFPQGVFLSIKRTNDDRDVVREEGCQRHNNDKGWMMRPLLSISCSLALCSPFPFLYDSHVLQLQIRKSCDNLVFFPKWLQHIYFGASHASSCDPPAPHKKIWTKVTCTGSVKRMNQKRQVIKSFLCSIFWCTSLQSSWEV